MATNEEKFTFAVQRVERAEKEIDRLQSELLAASDPQALLKEGYASPELEKLRVENQKLKYQLNHLKNYLAEEEKTVREYALDIRGIVQDVFTSAIYAAFPELPDPTILVVPSSKFDDYQCNSAMAIAQQLSSVTGKKSNPREVAQAIVAKLPATKFFEKVEIAGPGFINVALKKEFVTNQLTFLLTHGVKPPKVERKRVVVDYSSPNIAKEMHVGHLRSTVIGDSLSKLLEWVGHDVLRLNHLGDWGTQFGMLIAHLVEEYPNLLNERPAIEDLQAFYQESKKRFDSDEEFKRRAYDYVVKLQSKDPFTYKAWKIIYDISMEVNNELYKRLGVSDKLVERGESFYQDLMVKLIKDLENKGLIEVDENGRKVMFVPGFEVPLMLVKSDGGFTYDTSDLACIKQRLEEEKGDWIIYVVDSGQSTHLESIYAAARKLGWVDPSKHRIDHVGFGLVLGEDKDNAETNYFGLIQAQTETNYFGPIQAQRETNYFEQAHRETNYFEPIQAQRETNYFEPIQAHRPATLNKHRERPTTLNKHIERPTTLNQFKHRERPTTLNQFKHRDQLL
ncbi:arginine--tRNA ligase cytoplasmic [Biomphalaria pfeifferi]|uniref:arginine--tRNA ligase n=1 Tax=Biomphalaria pfeifferi TaxID=112525 RepID=A0AAD8AVP5_BIOPF|nr:arginine--tRNA ligase cytoplasmic [Biomphalaria pfeifferi]